MELDLANVRAFVAVAERATITAAANALFLTQQALSKRIARLEAAVGQLFLRTPHGVLLTERGERFLPHARQLLAVADETLSVAVGGPQQPLRVDVWGHPHPPRILVQDFARIRRDVVIELSMRRNLVHAVQALRRDELDVAFGNVASLDDPLPPDLTTELVCFTRGVALVNDTGPLADVAEFRPVHLRAARLWMPLSGSSPEVARFMHGYAESIGTRLLDEGANIGVESIVDRVAADPTLVALVDHAWSLPAGAAVHRVPIRPAPLYPWYAVRRVHGHPLAAQLVAAIRQDTSFVRVPEEHWLPDPISFTPA